MRDVQTKFPRGKVVRDRYVVEELLGKGGFGAVYRVRDKRVRGNVFALKEVVDPNPQERENFAFECEILKRLDHRSLPRVYRVFEDTRANSAYMLMDYIEGPNLEKLRKRQIEKRFPLAEVMRMMAPIIDAVIYLHAQHPPIIHRDIKPSNIIVPLSGEGAVLVDFGIAKEYDQDATTTAVRHCSPGYGAPEQYMRGTDTRTDIYGLGATFYTLLTGIVPVDALYRITCLGSKVPDPLEPPNQLTPEIPPPIAEAIVRSMALISADRFATVEEFWQTLQAYQGEEEQVAPVAHIVSRPDLEPLSNDITSRDAALHSSPRSDNVEVLVLNQADVAQNTPDASSFSESHVTTDSVAMSSALQVEREIAVPEPSVSVHPQRTGTSRIPVFVSGLVIFALIALLSGVAFGVSVWPTLNHSSGKQVQPPLLHTGSSPVASASAISVHTTPTAGSVHTTPTASAQASPGAATYPVLVSAYSGTILEKKSQSSTTLQLYNIHQNQANVNGGLRVGPGLLAAPTFSGTVATDKTIQFTTPSANGYLLPLLFTGVIRADGSMSGTYCGFDSTGRCNYELSGYGDWQVAPTGSPLSEVHQDPLTSSVAEAPDVWVKPQRNLSS